jgi:hypothetical protein
VWLWRNTVSDELERRLKDFPSEFPRPDEEVTRRVARQLRVRRRRAIPRAVTLVAALAVGAAIGSMATSASNSTVTIGVRPTIVRFGDKPEIFGAVTNAKAGETVTVQYRQCGLYPEQFRAFMTTQTIEGGAWNLDELFFVGTRTDTSGSFRALWGDEVSREVEFKVRAFVELRRLPFGRGFYARAGGIQSFWRKRVRVERFDRFSRRWILVRTLLLTETESSRNYGGSSLVVTSKPYRPAVRKGTTLRAVLPLASARPCYLAGYSKLVRA